MPPARAATVRALASVGLCVWLNGGAAQAQEPDPIDPQAPFLDLTGVSTSPNGRAVWLSLRTFAATFRAPGYAGVYRVTGPSPAGLTIVCSAPKPGRDAEARTRAAAKGQLRVDDHPEAPQTAPFYAPSHWLRELVGATVERYDATITLPGGAQAAVVERPRTSYAGGKSRLVVTFAPWALLEWLGRHEGEAPTPFDVEVRGEETAMALRFERHARQARAARRMARYCAGAEDARKRR